MFHVKQSALTEARARAAELNLTPNEANRLGLKVKADGARRNLLHLLARPDIDFGDLIPVWPELAAWAPEVREQVEIDAAYAGYLDRQAVDAQAFRSEEALALPAGLDFAAIGGLSNEVREKLTRVQPATLGQAGRIEGVTPGALAALLAHVRKAKAA